MDAALIVGSIALILSVFASMVSGYQVQRYWRFRKPVFRVEEAALGVDQQEFEGKRYARLGRGKVVINARGSMRLTQVREWGLSHYGPDGRPLGGFETGKLQPMPSSTGVAKGDFVVELPPEEWTRFQIDLGMMTVPMDELPDLYTFDLFLATPEEVHTIPVCVQLSGGGDTYVLQGEAATSFFDEKYSRRSPRPWVKRLLSRVGLPGRG